MSEAKLEALGAGRFRVAGDLVHATVDRLLGEDALLFDDGAAQIEIDLSAVSHTTSAGLALMLEWLRQARARNVAIRFSHVPTQIIGIARLSQLEDILPFDGGE